jgi:hypothetical protein
VLINFRMRQPRCVEYKLKYNIKYDMIYLLTAIGLSPGGSSIVHIYTQTVHRTTQITTEQQKQQLMWKSASRAPSLRVLPWHLPYN